MKKRFKSIALSFVLVGGILFSGLSSKAATKHWNVYHNQGAPSTAGVFLCSNVMPKGGEVVEVTMTSYENLAKTSIKAYRAGHKADGKYLSKSHKTINLYVPRKESQKILISMSTTSDKSTFAKGTMIR